MRRDVVARACDDGVACVGNATRRGTNRAAAHEPPRADRPAHMKTA